ncbi:MAG: hypothetical protein Q8M29_04915 [Bacteroidota bacterium]|nr:hypothetical protein [Bacteroidota bacterium]
MSQPKIKYQHITFKVTTAGQEVSIDAETDKLYKRVTGVNVVLTEDSNKFSTLELEINTVELFPEYFEVLRLLFRDQVPFGFEYHSLNEKAEGSKVKGKYRDVENGSSYPYYVTISLRLQND